MIAARLAPHTLRGGEKTASSRDLSDQALKAAKASREVPGIIVRIEGYIIVFEGEDQDMIWKAIQVAMSWLPRTDHWVNPIIQWTATPPSHCPGCDSEEYRLEPVTLAHDVILIGRCHACGYPDFHGRTPTPA